MCYLFVYKQLGIARVHTVIYRGIVINTNTGNKFLIPPSWWRVLMNMINECTFLLTYFLYCSCSEQQKFYCYNVAPSFACIKGGGN